MDPPVQLIAGNGIEVSKCGDNSFVVSKAYEPPAQPVKMPQQCPQCWSWRESCDYPGCDETKPCKYCYNPSQALRFHSYARPIPGYEVDAAFMDTWLAEYHWYAYVYGALQLVKARTILNVVE